jgi:hypothetical protein
MYHRGKTKSTYLFLVTLAPSCLAMTLRWSQEALHSFSNLLILLANSSKSTLEARVTAPICEGHVRYQYIGCKGHWPWLPRSRDRWTQGTSPWPCDTGDVTKNVYVLCPSLQVPSLNTRSGNPLPVVRRCEEKIFRESVLFRHNYTYRIF